MGDGGGKSRQGTEFPKGADGRGIVRAPCAAADGAGLST